MPEPHDPSSENTKDQAKLTPEIVRERIARRLNISSKAKIREAARKRKLERSVLPDWILHWSTTRILVCLFALVLIATIAFSMPLPVACILIPLVAIYFLTGGTRWD